MFSCWFDVNVWFLGMFVLFQSLRQSMGWGGVGGGWGGLITFMSAAGRMWCYGMLRCEDVEVTSGTLWMLRCEDVEVTSGTLWMLRCEEVEVTSGTLWMLRCEDVEVTSGTLWMLRCEDVEVTSGTLWMLRCEDVEVTSRTLWMLRCEDVEVTSGTLWMLRCEDVEVTSGTKLDLAWIYCRNLENSWNRSTRRSDTGSEQTADVKKLRMCFGNMFSKSIFSKNRVFATAKTTRS